MVLQSRGHHERGSRRKMDPVLRTQMKKDWSEDPRNGKMGASHLQPEKGPGGAGAGAPAKRPGRGGAGKPTMTGMWLDGDAPQWGDHAGGLDTL